METVSLDVIGVVRVRARSGRSKVEELEAAGLIDAQVTDGEITVDEAEVLEPADGGNKLRDPAEAVRPAGVGPCALQRLKSFEEQILGPGGCQCASKIGVRAPLQGLVHGRLPFHGHQAAEREVPAMSVVEMRRDLVLEGHLENDVSVEPVRQALRRAYAEAFFRRLSEGHCESHDVSIRSVTAVVPNETWKRPPCQSRAAGDNN